MANDDVVMMYKLIKDGCDINYNDTAMEVYSYEGYFEYEADYDNFTYYAGCPDYGCGYWIAGNTPLHIAGYEGSIGE